MAVSAQPATSTEQITIELNCEGMYDGTSLADHKTIFTACACCNCGLLPMGDKCEWGCGVQSLCLCCKHFLNCRLVSPKNCCAGANVCTCLEWDPEINLMESKGSGRYYCCCDGSWASKCRMPGWSEEKPCCKVREHCCCLRCNVSLPPDSDGPIALAILGIFLCGKPDGF